MTPKRSLKLLRTPCSLTTLNNAERGLLLPEFLLILNLNNSPGFMTLGTGGHLDVNTMLLLMIQTNSCGFTGLHHITPPHTHTSLTFANYSYAVVSGHKVLVQHQVINGREKLIATWVLFRTDSQEIRLLPRDCGVNVQYLFHKRQWDDLSCQLPWTDLKRFEIVLNSCERNLFDSD